MKYCLLSGVKAKRATNKSCNYLMVLRCKFYFLLFFLNIYSIDIRFLSVWLVSFENFTSTTTTKRLCILNYCFYVFIIHWNSNSVQYALNHLQRWKRSKNTKREIKHRIKIRILIFISGVLFIYYLLYVFWGFRTRSSSIVFQIFFR